MENKAVFKQYRSRMTTEGVINAILCGFAIGGGLFAAISLVCILCNAGLALTLGLGLGLGVCAGVGSALLFYFFKFQPTVRNMARRADAAGLEERAITMLQYESDPSCLAQFQREDAAEHIEKAAPAALKKLRVSSKAIASASVAAAADVAAIVFVVLMALHVLPPIIPINPPVLPDGYIAVSYLVEEGGEINGEEEQLISAGENAEPVEAVPDEGWAFVEWSDGVLEPYRYDINVSEDLTVTAFFEEVEDGEGEGGDGENDNDSDNDSDSDDDSDKPSEDQNQQQQEGPSDEDQKPQDPPPSESDNNAGGRYEEKNQIINGSTYYRDVDYYEAVIKKLTSGEEISQEEREFIEKYFGSI